MKALAVAGVNLRLLLRDRTNLLFVFALPMLIVLVLGAVNAGYEPRLAVVVEDPTDALATELAEAIEAIDGVRVERFADEAPALAQLRRDDVDGLVVIPAGHGRALRAGGVSELRYAASPDEGFVLRGVLDDAVAAQAARVRAARTADVLGAVPFEQGLVTAAREQAGSAVSVAVVDDDGRPWAEQRRVTDQIAGQQLVLFMFLTALTASTTLIRARSLGLMRRMLATPTPVSSILTGEVGGRYVLTVGQGVFIALATALLFGVTWGSWGAAAAVIVVFAVVGVGAATLLAVLVADEQQAGGLAMVLGISFGALGGSMFPLEIFPDTVRVVAHLTPHAWANDAFTTLIEGGGGLADITTELAVLGAYGAALLGLSLALLRGRLSREAHVR